MARVLTGTKTKTVAKKTTVKKAGIGEKGPVKKSIFRDYNSDKLTFGFLYADDTIKEVDYKTWKQSTLKDSSSDISKKDVINRIVRKQKQLNKKVDYNLWSKKTNPSFTDTIDYFIKSGWITNVNKTGLKA